MGFRCITCLDKRSRLKVSQAFVTDACEKTLIPFLNSTEKLVERTLSWYLMLVSLRCCIS